MLELSLLRPASRIRLRQRHHRRHRLKPGQRDQQGQQDKKEWPERLVRPERKEKKPSQGKTERPERPEQPEQPERRARLELRDKEAGKILIAISGLGVQKGEGNATFPFFCDMSDRSKTANSGTH